jgi:alpha-tubulin suppressor-like RCC1 family protein
LNVFTQVHDFNQQAVQVSAGIEHALILTRDHKVYAMGNNTEGNLGLGHTYSSDTPLQVHGGLNQLKIVDVGAGRHSAAISEEGRLFVWG